MLCAELAPSAAAVRRGPDPARQRGGDACVCRQGERARRRRRAQHDDLGVRRVPRAPRRRFIRPDVGIAGGITHVKKICALGRGLPRRRAFPTPCRPDRSPSRRTCSSACACPTGRCRSTSPRTAPHGRTSSTSVIEVRDGYLIAPDRPGIGIDLDDAGLARHPPVVGRPLGPAAARGRLGGDQMSERRPAGARRRGRPRVQRGDPGAATSMTPTSRASRRSPTSRFEAFSVALGSQRSGAARRESPRRSWRASPPTSTCWSSATARPSSAPRCSRPRRG